MKNAILSLIRRRPRAPRPRNAAISTVDVAIPQTRIPQAIHAEVHHEPRLRSRKPAGYTNGTYLPRSRRSGFGSRQSMFRIT